jgi:hypothetical protein
MVTVTVYVRDPDGLTRVGTGQIFAAPVLQGVNIVLDPPGCVPDGVALRIKTDVIAGADYGDVDWWHWRKEVWSARPHPAEVIPTDEAQHQASPPPWRRTNSVKAASSRRVAKRSRRCASVRSFVSCVRTSWLR